MTRRRRRHTDRLAERPVPVGRHRQSYAGRSRRQADSGRGAAGRPEEDRHPADYALPRRSHWCDARLGEANSHRHVHGPWRVDRNQPAAGGGRLQGLRRAIPGKAEDSPGRRPDSAEGRRYSVSHRGKAIPQFERRRTEYGGMPGWKDRAAPEPDPTTTTPDSAQVRQVQVPHLGVSRGTGNSLLSGQPDRQGGLNGPRIMAWTGRTRRSSSGRSASRGVAMARKCGPASVSRSSESLRD